MASRSLTLANHRMSNTPRPQTKAACSACLPFWITPLRSAQTAPSMRSRVPDACFPAHCDIAYAKAGLYCNTPPRCLTHASWTSLIVLASETERRIGYGYCFLSFLLSAQPILNDSCIEYSAAHDPSEERERGHMVPNGRERFTPN